MGPDWYGVAGARMVACWLWLPMTEQNVFITMLAYRINPKLPAKLMMLSSILYVATRVFGIVMSLIAFGVYISCGLQNMHLHPEHGAVFALCVCIQICGFGVMIWAQYNSAKSQWGLAGRQQSK